MAIGSNLAGVARVAVEVDTGTSEQQLAAFDRKFTQSTGSMSEGAIRVELATRRLQRALATYPAESDKVLRATVALKAAQRSAAADAGTLARQTSHAGSAFGKFAHDVERGGLGLAAGTRAVHGLRSALLFGGVGFASGFGISTFLRSARDAALGQQVALGQLQAALHAAGIEESAYAGRVHEVIDANEKLGFSEKDSVNSLSLAVRATRDVEKAHALQALAADVARGRNMNLVAATQLLVRVQAGQVGSLRRLGIEVAKGISGTKALEQVQRQYAGAASTYADSAAGAQDRLNVAVHHTEETIGQALLPSITSLNTRLANWLDNSHNQERIQKQVNAAVHTGGTIVHGLANAFNLASAAIRPVNRLLGGSQTTIRLLGAVLLGLKLKSLAAEMGLFGLKTQEAGAKAQVAAGQYANLAVQEERAATAPAAGVPGSGIPGTYNPGSGRVGLPGGGLPTGIAALPLYALGAIPDARSVDVIPIVGATGGYLDTHDPILPGHKRPRPGQTVTYKGRKYIYVVENGRQALVDLDTYKQLQGVGNVAPADSLNPRANVPRSPAYVDPTTTRRRRLSLQGRFNVAAYNLALAGTTTTTADDDKYLNQELAIIDKQIAREKNLAKKTALVDQRNGILGQLQSNRDQRTQSVADAARKRAAARRKAQQAATSAARAAEGRAYGAATDTVQRLGAQARRFAGRGQFDDERATLRAEEHDLEQYVKDATLSVAHRRQLQRRLDGVRQQIDNIGRQIRAAAVKAAAARSERQDLLIQRQIARAELTDRTDDDLRAYRAQEAVIKKRLAALARVKHLTNQQIQAQTDLLQQKKQVDDQIMGIVGQSKTDSSASIRDAISTLGDIIANESNVAGTTIHVHQNFPHPPTGDGRREAIMAHHAIQASFA